MPPLRSGSPSAWPPTQLSEPRCQGKGRLRRYRYRGDLLGSSWTTTVPERAEQTHKTEAPKLAIIRPRDLKIEHCPWNTPSFLWLELRVLGCPKRRLEGGSLSPGNVFPADIRSSQTRSDLFIVSAGSAQLWCLETAVTAGMSSEKPNSRAGTNSLRDANTPRSRQQTTARVPHPSP